MNEQMENTTLNILEHEDKTSLKGKDYTRFKTNEGWLSCFEKDTIAKLKENKGKNCRVITATSDNGKFRNIRTFIEVSNDSTTDEGNSSPKALVSKPKPAFNQSSMYVSYAKDIFMQLRKEANEHISDESIMDNAIDMIKSAIKAFE